MSNHPRFNLSEAYPAALRAMYAFNKASKDSELDPTINELIKIRASQLNGCGFCLDMHTKDARALGESEQRIYLLNAWREVDLYTDAERAALALTEAVTNVADGHVPDEVLDEARKHFDEQTLGKVLLAIVVINAWNRFMITQDPPVGDYVSQVSR